MSIDNNLTKQQLEELVFTKEELMELENSRNMPITFDDDCPETTPERAIRFKRVNPQKKNTDNNLRKVVLI